MTVNSASSGINKFITQMTNRGEQFIKNSVNVDTVGHGIATGFGMQLADKINIIQRSSSLIADYVNQSTDKVGHIIQKAVSRIF